MSRSLPPLSILGCGRFGRLLACELARQGPIGVHDPRFEEESGFAPLEPPAHVLSLEDAAGSRVVILAVPIRTIPETLRRIAPHLRPGALVVDTASVKTWPMRWMNEHLPPSVDYLGTHPLFGPDSAGDGLAEQSIVLVPGRMSRPRPIRRFLRRLGLRVIDRSAEEHDREMAEAQALVHWLGRGLAEIGVSPRECQTLGYRRLCEVLAQVTRDTPELFEDLERWNPYASVARARLLDALTRLDAFLGPSSG